MPASIIFLETDLKNQIANLCLSDGLDRLCVVKGFRKLILKMKLHDE